MIFNMTGDGSNPLNFQVKTYPSETELKADNPKENTIGVITTTTMSSWVFSATEPAEPEVGMVWIRVEKSSIVEFNALKKNALNVYPIDAQQYVGGAFADVVAKSYQNAAWNDWWNGELYIEGNEYENITGGWTVSGYTHYNTLNAATKEANRIKLQGSSSANQLSGTDKPIDLTEFSQVCVDIEVTGAASNGASLTIGIGKTKYVVDMIVEQAAGATIGRRTINIDVSAVNEPMYIFVFAQTSNSCSGYLYKCWGVK